MATRLINRYHFLVDWGGIRTEFLEVSGLEMTIEVIAVREGSSKVESENKNSRPAEVFRRFFYESHSKRGQ